MTDDNSTARVTFLVEPDEDGSAMAESETMWANIVDDGFEIDNIPFYVRGIAYLDVVSAEMDDGLLCFRDVVRRSGHHTVRIWVWDDSIVYTVAAECVELGCSWEGAGKDHEQLIAIDIPPEADKHSVQAWLNSGFEQKRFDYEEGLVDWVSIWKDDSE